MASPETRARRGGLAAGPTAATATVRRFESRCHGGPLHEVALAAVYDWMGMPVRCGEFPAVARRRRMCRGLSA